MSDSTRFVTQANPGEERCAQIAKLSPHNPFHTGEFLAFRRGLGAEVWSLGVETHGELTAACPAFLTGGRMKRRLEIQSLPTLGEGAEIFWPGLEVFCAEQQVSELSVNTFASECAEIPALGREAWRKARVEHVLRLDDTDLDAGVSSKHRYSIRRANKEGVTIRRGDDRQAFQAHADMTGASMDRQRERGEDAAIGMALERIQRMMQSGMAELYQAVAGGEVVSSAIVATAARGGYYYSAGTSPDGLRQGASHLLVYEIAKTLQEQSKERFNLGGTGPDQEGLIRFKKRFGASEVALEAGSFSMRGAVGQLVLDGAESIVAKTRAALRRSAS